MLVLNAHYVSDTSGEGFAVRLFRKGNQRGFIRALSDQPAFFAAGFNKVRPHCASPLTRLSISACMQYLFSLPHCLEPRAPMPTSVRRMESACRLHTA